MRSKKNPLCTDCRKRVNTEYQRTYRNDNPLTVRKANLWRLYRITLDQYEEMRERQGRQCAACRIHESDIDTSRQGGRRRRDGTRAESFPLQVDHCHRTNVIRGLLCPDCNKIIGLADENPERLTGCIDYLAANPT